MLNKLDPSTFLMTLGFDQLSWILTITILSLFLIQWIIGTADQSWLIHPIILGHQADFSAIRNQSETPIITNSASNRGLIPVSPDRSIKSLYDLLIKSEGKLHKIDSSSPIPSNLSLKLLISHVRSHIWSLLKNTQFNQDESHPQLMILSDDPHVKLVFSLASATLPIVTIMANTYQSGALPVDVKQVIAPYLGHLSLIISDISEDLMQESLGSSHLKAHVISIKDISNWFLAHSAPDPPVVASELSRAKLLMVHNLPKSNDAGRSSARVYEFSSKNLLAGITSSLGLFPLNGKLTSKDKVALESYGEVSIWGSQISIAVAALYAGADVYFFDGFKHLSECKPTVLVIKAMTAQILAEQVIQLSKLSFFKKLAIAHRLSKISNGVLPTPLSETTEWVGPKLRSIITDDSISQCHANLIRAGFGATLQRIHTHPISAGPILATQPYDFQTLQPLNAPVHCGPPSVNVECKIINVPEPSLTDNNAWKGKLLARGPSMAIESLPDTPSTNHPSDPSANQRNFYPVAQSAYVLPNGTFHVLSDFNLGDD